jgi:ribonuclease VapC
MVLDTSAVVAMHLREAGHDRLLDCLEYAPSLAIGAPTLVECALVLSSRVGPDARPMLADFLATHFIETVPFTKEHYRVATAAFLRYGKGRHRAKLNLGDCLAYATAMVADMPLLYVGNDFAQTDVRPALQ